MDVRQVYDDGLCTQCGTCAGACPRGAVSLEWELPAGYRVRVDTDACTDCGVCVAARPGPGLDCGAGAWWRKRNDGAPACDFLGPWRGLWFGWAAAGARDHLRGARDVAQERLYRLLADRHYPSPARQGTPGRRD